MLLDFKFLVLNGYNFLSSSNYVQSLKEFSTFVRILFNFILQECFCDCSKLSFSFLYIWESYTNSKLSSKIENIMNKGIPNENSNEVNINEQQ